MIERLRRGSWLVPWLVVVLVPVAIARPAAAEAGQEAEHLLWEARADAGTVWLLGSLHFGRADMYPLAREIERAFERADALVVEANVLAMDAAQTLEAFTAGGMYAGEETLRDHVSAGTWAALEQAAQRYGLPVTVFERQKPWLAAITLSAMELNRQGLTETLGIDRYFLEQAGDEKRIVELESVRQQLGIFEQLSGAEQEAFLAATLNELEQGGDYFDRIVTAWRQGDAAALDELLNGSFRSAFGSLPAARSVYRRLLLDRNRAMADKVRRLLEDGGRYFVVIGAGHLVGEQSVVEHLRESGVRVTQQ